MDSEIESKSKRVQNLVSLVAELPADIPADIFYHQIKETNQKIQELKRAKQELLSKAITLKGRAIDKDDLVRKIKNTVEKLDETPVESRRPLYGNLIQFAELHSTKIKVGVIAPAQGQCKATGTDGAPGAESDFQNFEGEPGKVIDLVRRGGSTSVTIGAQEPEVEEPLSESKVRLFRPEALFQVEFEVAAEPKALLPQELRNSVQKYGSFSASGRALGVSEAFVRQNAQEKKYTNKRGVK